MKTAMSLIKAERENQISHGYDLNFHLKNPTYYANKELVSAADFCMDPANLELWPKSWRTDSRDKIIKKSRLAQLACAGAFMWTQEEVFRSTAFTAGKVSKIFKLMNAIIKSEPV